MIKKIQESSASDSSEIRMGQRKNGFGNTPRQEEVEQERARLCARSFLPPGTSFTNTLQGAEQRKHKQQAAVVLNVLCLVISVW